MTLYWNPQISTKSILDVINGFCKLAECKINTQKLGDFLYTNNKRSEK